METVILISLGAVAVALLAGMWNMMRGGSASRSQTLMRWRVGLQFLAIIMLLISFYVAAG